MTETSATSFVDLSRSPFFERRWASLDEAFEDGRIDSEGLPKGMSAHLPKPRAGERLLLGIDASGIARPESRPWAQRTVVLGQHLPASRTPPLTAGWPFSSLMVLAEPASRWGYILDQRRIASQQTAGEVAAVQLREGVALLPQGLPPRLPADRYYPRAACVRATVELACGKLLRWKRRRVFYRAAPRPRAIAGPHAKMASALLAMIPARLGLPRPTGKAKRLAASASRSTPGSTCT